MKTAIKTDYFQGFRDLRTLKTEENAKKNGKDPSDQALFEMSTSEGWRVLNTFIDSLKGDLDQMVKVLMEQGATYEVIGQKTIVKELCKEMLERIQHKVDDARTEIES